MSDAELLLEVNGIAKRYGAVIALRDASLHVRAGEVHALMGANGAGKSTLVKILTGAVQPDAGEIILRGEPRQVHSPAEARRTGLVSVYQEPSVVPDLTVEENLALTGTPREPFHERVAELGIEDLDMRARARDLPLATQRVIDLARALSTDPDVLLLDEMTAALPANLTERVLDVVRARHESGQSVIFISHRLLEISAICDRATVLRDGETVGVVDIGPGAEEQIVGLMLGSTEGRGDEAARQPTTAGGAEPSATKRPVPRLTARNLAAGTRLHDVSFELHAGEVLGVAALEGQGQDELFEVLSGSMRPTAGEVQVNGRRARFGHPADAIRAGVVLVPADRALAVLRQRSVRENIALPFYARPRRWGPIDMAAEARDVGGAIDRLQIDTRAGAEVQRLSGGNQQKVTIARWIAGGVETLLCFDPTRGIDIGTKREIYQLLRDLAAGGAAVLLYTSELDEIPQVCDRTVVIYRGQVVDEVARHEADEPTLLRAAYGLPRGTKLPEEVAVADAVADVTASTPGATA